MSSVLLKYTVHLLRCCAQINPQRIKDTPAVNLCSRLVSVPSISKGLRKGCIYFVEQCTWTYTVQQAISKGGRRVKSISSLQHRRNTDYAIRVPARRGCSRQTASYGRLHRRG